MRWSALPAEDLEEVTLQGKECLLVQLIGQGLVLELYLQVVRRNTVGR